MVAEVTAADVKPQARARAQIETVRPELHPLRGHGPERFAAQLNAFTIGKADRPSMHKRGQEPPVAGRSMSPLARAFDGWLLCHEERYFGGARLDDDLRNAAEHDRHRRAGERGRHAEATTSNIGLRHDIRAALGDAADDQLRALPKSSAACSASTTSGGRRGRRRHSPAVCAIRGAAHQRAARPPSQTGHASGPRRRRPAPRADRSPLSRQVARTSRSVTRASTRRPTSRGSRE
jgi:hypothetical protein